MGITKNARAALLLEPLLGIPTTMYMGYMTLYMLAIGLTKVEVGIVTSIGLTFNFIFASQGAYITDRLGRRKTTLIFDTISWALAQLIWATANSMLAFVIAYIVNASVQIVSNSFLCLILEDNESEKKIHIFNFLQISVILAGFFAPIGIILINKMTLIPAVRTMQMFGMISVLVLIISRHLLVRETSIGIQKMNEMKDVRITQIYKAYIPTFKRIIKNRMLVLVLFLRVLNQIQLTIRNTYLAILVTERMGFAAGNMSIFFTVNSIVILLVILFVSPVISKSKSRRPIVLGISVHISATIILLISPETHNYLLLVLSAVLVAFGTALTTPYIDSLAANTIVDEDRAASNSVISMAMMLFTIPFGYIGGILSDFDPRTPFVLTFVVFILCLVIVGIIVKNDKRVRVNN